MHIVYPAVVSALLFSIGVYGVLARRNTILVLMSVELMLNAVNLNLVAFDVWLGDRLHSGQVLTLFVIVIAAAEVGLGLAIVLALYRNRRTVDLDCLRDLAEPADGHDPAAPGDSQAQAERRTPMTAGGGATVGDGRPAGRGGQVATTFPLLRRDCLPSRRRIARPPAVPLRTAWGAPAQSNGPAVPASAALRGRGSARANAPGGLDRGRADRRRARCWRSGWPGTRVRLPRRRRPPGRPWAHLRRDRAPAAVPISLTLQADDLSGARSACW